MLVSSPYVLDSVSPIHAGQQLASTVEDDESLEKLLIQLLCNLSGFKNNQQKLGALAGCGPLFFVFRTHALFACTRRSSRLRVTWHCTSHAMTSH